jgi:peptidoglycan/LPS O-acetylase OafA/YrhL
MNLFFLCSRYIHIVATAMIVGGTLFYEMVVPPAIDDLKTEVQLAVFGRMRWVFRWVVYSSTIALLITGGVSAYRNYDKVLKGDFLSFLAQRSSPEEVEHLETESIFNRPKPWFIAHLAAGALSLLIAVALVSGGKPPERPLQWMRLNLFLLMIAIFLGSASRGARQNLFDPVLSGATAPAPAAHP